MTIIDEDQQRKRVVSDLLAYTKVFTSKVDGYVGAINQGTATPEEFKEYLHDSIKRINLLLMIVRNLEKKISELAVNDKGNRMLLEHIRTVNSHWKSTALIIDGISKAEDKDILKAYKKFEKILDRNKTIILSEGDTLYKKMTMFS